MSVVDAYLEQVNARHKDALVRLCQIIRKAAPDAEEAISYGMPAFKLNGPLVYFAAFKNHIGLHALPSGNAAFRKELKTYKTGKGSIQFPHNQELPVALIEKIVRFRVEENEMESKKSGNLGF